MITRKWTSGGRSEPGERKLRQLVSIIAILKLSSQTLLSRGVSLGLGLGLDLDIAANKDRFLCVQPDTRAAFEVSQLCTLAQSGCVSFSLARLVRLCQQRQPKLSPKHYKPIKMQFYRSLL